jgi:MFS transporter
MSGCDLRKRANASLIEVHEFGATKAVFANFCYGVPMGEELESTRGNFALLSQWGRLIETRSLPARSYPRHLNFHVADPISSILNFDFMSPRLALLVIAVVFVILNADITTVNVALVTVGKDLHSDLENLQWGLNTYMLAFAALIVAAGRAADVFGHRRCLLAGSLFRMGFLEAVPVPLFESLFPSL